MDGYDEYDSKEENFVKDIFLMDDNPFIKLIITSRKDYVTHEEI